MEKLNVIYLVIRLDGGIAFIGVFDTEKQAIDNCFDLNCFVAEVALNIAYPQKQRLNVKILRNLIDNKLLATTIEESLQSQIIIAQPITQPIEEKI